jgi:hypothetical protein
MASGGGQAWRKEVRWKVVVVVVQDQTPQKKTRPCLVELVESLVFVVGSGEILPAAGPSPEVGQMPIPIGADDGPGSGSGRASPCAASACAASACAASACASPTSSLGAFAAASAMYTGLRWKEGSPFWACFYYYLGAHPNFYGAPR